MSRSKVRRVSDPAAIQPAAAPVNSYVRPADPAPSPLHDVAKGLAALDSGLSSFLGKRQGDIEEADAIKGKAAFNANNQAAWSEAVKSGAVPANSSPHFMKAYKKSQGNLAGIKLREKFRVEFNQWGDRDSDDPVAFQNFVSEFVSKHVTTEDTDVLRGINPHVDAIIENGYQQHSKERSDRVYKDSIGTSAATIGEDISAANNEGSVSENGTDYNAMWDRTKAVRDEALRSGIRREDLDAQIVETIIDKAVETGDPKILDLLDRKLPGYDHKLSDMPSFRGKKQAALERLKQKQRREEVSDGRKQRALDKKREDTIVRGVSRAIAQDPTIKVPEDILKEWEKHDPMARSKLSDIRSKLTNGGPESDKDLLEVQRAIREGGGEAEINQAVRDGIITNPQTYASMLDRLDKYRKMGESKDGKKVLSSDVVRRYQKAIKTRTEKGGFADPLGLRGLSDDGLRATENFNEAIIEWHLANPDATFLERNKALNEIGRSILDDIDPANNSYTPKAEPAPPQSPKKAEATPPAPLTIKPEEPIVTVARTASPEDLKTLQNAYSGDKPPLIDRLPASTQKQLEDMAKRKGQTVEEINMKIWQKVHDSVQSGEKPTKEAPTVKVEKSDRIAKKTAPKAPVSKITEEVPGETTEAPKKVSVSIPKDTKKAIKDALDTQAAKIKKTGKLPNRSTTKRNTGGFYPKRVSHVAPVLDLIGHTEGTDRGRGYNETLSYGAYTGGKVDLTKMTLNEIDKLQTKMLRHPKNKLNSSAAGRYQIIRTTLRKLRKKLKLTGKELYDEDFQDALALVLLEGRGYSSWKAGKISNKRFIGRLAQEWASFPKWKGGGHYKGQRAAVSSKVVMAALRKSSPSLKKA